MGLVSNWNDNPAFSLQNMTEAIMVVPNSYGRITELGIFRDWPVNQQMVSLEKKNGILNLLPTKARGAPSTVGSNSYRDAWQFAVPHIPHDDYVPAESVHGVRRFGSDNELEGVLDVVAEKLMTMSEKHDITHEHLKAGAIRGVILDADGSVIYDLNSIFGITPKTVDFALATPTTKVRLKCLEVVNHINKNLKGEIRTSIRAFASEGWWSAFIEHDEVKAAFDRWQNGDYLRQDPTAPFVYGGIEWEQYLGEADDVTTDPSSPTSRPFIPTDTVRFVPMGTRQTFVEYIAPADFNETVGTLGLRKYAKTAEAEFERGVKIHTQSNVLPICTRPELLVEGTTS